MIRIRHNFDETKFTLLWAKYVKGGNIEKHGTAAIIGPYSKKFSGTSNQDLLKQPVIVMDEVPNGQYDAIYFCGVIKNDYPNCNYSHSVHFAVVPEPHAKCTWDFENWHVEIDGGELSYIPSDEELVDLLKQSPCDSLYYTYSIFHWMVGFYYPQYIDARKVCETIGYDLALWCLMTQMEYAIEHAEEDEDNGDYDIFSGFDDQWRESSGEFVNGEKPDIYWEYYLPNGVRFIPEDLCDVWDAMNNGYIKLSDELANIENSIDGVGQFLKTKHVKSRILSRFR